MINPMSWHIMYPLGLAAEALISGDNASAVAAVKALLERAPNAPACGAYLRECYETEAYLIDRQEGGLDQRLKPLWVADKAIRKPGLTPPGLMQYSLNVFLKIVESK